MERLITIDQKTINKGGPDQYSLPKILRWTGASREYLMSGVWTSEKPTQKPDGSRVVFPTIEQFRVAKDTYFAWQELSSRQTVPPEFPDVTLERLFQSRLRDKPLTLFVPWGVRPVGTFGQSEIEALETIERFSNDLQERKIDAKALIMPADLYATEVNNQVDVSFADAYFQIVTSEAFQKGFAVKPWSAIRQENQETYDKLRSELNPRAILPSGILERALKAAGRRSGYEDDKSIEAAAFAYLQERLCEAEIIENLYQPIKVSMVMKGKDAYVDRNLPRVYILPERLQFPWLQTI
ncbi:MAG TPA: hypothetical protein VLF68_01605 [Candidatus Saccharimonadales bacterium]|nr:hypothetical protein [Candidatus Saccharimonadales bacterium]